MMNNNNANKENMQSTSHSVCSEENQTGNVKKGPASAILGEFLNVKKINKY